jgi:hypothetical protein
MEGGKGFNHVNLNLYCIPKDKGDKGILKTKLTLRLGSLVLNGL